MEPLGGTPEWWRLITGIAVYLAAIIALMIYLWWKLPDMRNKKRIKKDDIGNGAGTEDEENGDYEDWIDDID